MMFKKKILVLMMIFALILTAAPVMANEEPVMYQDTISVTADGGRYQVGFVNIEFKKDFLDPDMLPATFEVSVYLEDGVGYVEFDPGTPNFFKKVHIRVGKYEGLLYDKALGENIEITVKNQQILADHFSRYAWSW